MRQITEMFAFVAEDTKDDLEGIIGMQIGSNWHPFVGADMNMMEKLRGPAKKIALATKKKVKLIKFTVREELPL